MARYRLASWQSPDLFEVSELVMRLLSSLPSPCIAGCFSSYFYDWETAATLKALPSCGRFSAMFSGVGVPLEVLQFTPQCNLGNARIKKSSTQTVLYRGMDTPFYGHRGEIETDVRLQIEEVLDSARLRRPERDPRHSLLLLDVARRIGMDVSEESVHACCIHGLSRDKISFSYQLSIPISLGVAGILELSRRLIPWPDRIDWEVIGSFETVQSALHSLHGDARIGSECGPYSAGSKGKGPYFALERVAPFRPIANVQLADVPSLVGGLISIHTKLSFPALYFGPLIWPLRTLVQRPIMQNFLRISSLENLWRTEIGMWQESDEDPTVRDIRKHVEPIIQSLRPTTFEKVAYAIDSD
ncbi:MAG: hypothetical protein H7210_03570 [Pyrinomonadaceae bacterium]|nr:hypothetical protein [Phycisphaerales bacterium]